MPSVDVGADVRLAVRTVILLEIAGGDEDAACVTPPP
jgi:hypothetical protein